MVSDCVNCVAWWAVLWWLFSGKKPEPEDHDATSLARQNLPRIENGQATRVQDSRPRLEHHIISLFSFDGPKKGFRVTAPSDMVPLSATSFFLDTTLIRNRQVPFQYGFVLGYTRNKEMYHAGLLFKGDFEVGTVKYKLAFADRLHDGIEIHFFNTEESVGDMFRRFSCRNEEGVHEFAEYDVKSWYFSWTPAWQLHDFICTELGRTFSLFGIQSARDLQHRQDLTNCIGFTCRGGAELAVDGESFLTDSSSVMGQICDRRIQPRTCH